MDGTPSTEKDEYWNGDIKWLSSGETSQDFIFDTINKITIEGVKNSSTKLANKGDVVMACAGQGKTRGQVSYLLDDMYVNQSVIVLKPNEEIVDSLYLYYNLKNRYDELRGGSDASSTRGSITTASLKKLNIELPPIEHQKAISQVLLKYDEMIRNNSQRIMLLKRMAQEIYNEWFVRFRYPGYSNYTKTDSKIGKIPTCFKIKPIIEVVDYYIGGGWGNDHLSNEYTEPGYVIRGTDFENTEKNDISSIPYRYHKKSNIKTRLLQPNDIVIEISGGTQEQPVGRTIIVTKNLLDTMKENCICASFCKLIRCKNNISPLYFQYWMSYLYDTRIIDRYQLQSTGIINFKFEYFLKKGFVMVPPKELMDKFEEIIIPIYNEIGKLGKENQNLIKQRDLLLPRLMSGKLEVK